MKRVEVFQENVNKIVFFDLDDSDISDYVKSLSSLLELSKVSVLHATSASVILRPSKIVSLLVTEIEKVEGLKEEVVIDKKSIMSEEQIDTITDG